MARLKYKLEGYDIQEIDTKLGRVKVNVSKSICFPKGIVGFADSHYYCIAEIPENKMPGALLLQSIDDLKLGFIVIPLAEKFYKGENPLIEWDDIEAATKSYDINESDLTIFAITSLTKKEDKINISINLKAPIIMDGKERTAYQHVFISRDYPLAYPLN